MLLAFITENWFGEAILMNTHIIVLWSRGCESNEYLQHTILWRNVDTNRFIIIKYLPNLILHYAS